MKLFITGATGFIGTHLCRRLVEDGHEVVALLRSPHKKKLLPDSVEVIQGDLTLFEQEGFRLPHFDVVIHLAGVISAKTQADYYRINYDAVRHLANCLEKQEKPLKRFIFASSLAAAGPSNGRTPLDETMPLAPVDNYGAAKMKAEEFLEGYSRPVTSFRPAIVLGPGDENSLTLYKMAQSGIAFRASGPEQVVSFVDIDDLVESIVCMVGDEREGHQRYFVAHEEPIEMLSFWKVLGEKLNKRVRVLPVPKVVLFGLMKASTLFSRLLGIRNQLDEKQYKQIITPTFVCSGMKLQRELGWKPRFDLSASLDKAILGYKKDGDL